MGKRISPLPDFGMNKPIREQKVPDVDDATDCALRNSKTECEGLKEKECKGCHFWCPKHFYEWDKENQKCVSAK